MTTNRHFDWIAPLYGRLIRPPDTARLRALLDLPSPGWMLDAAGGTGRVAAALCPLVDRLVVSDLSLPMLQNIEGELHAARDGCIYPAQGRVERLPFADEQFTRILVVDAFHHFADQPGSLRELARVLAPGGRLVIEEPDIRCWPVKLIALAETLLLMGSHFRAPALMRQMLAAEGLAASLVTEDNTAWAIGVKA